MIILVTTNKHKLIKTSLVSFVLALLLSIISFFLFDQKLSQFFGNEDIRPFRLFSREVTDYGLAEYYFILSVVIFSVCGMMISRFKLDQNIMKKLIWWKAWSINLFFSLLFGGFIVHLFKFLLGRQRPHKSAPEFSPDIFTFFKTHWDFHSLPSGHSQVSATVATLLILAFPRFWFLILPAFTFIIFTRVITHDHFLSDVIMGAMTGLVCSLWVLYWIHQKGKNSILKENAPAVDSI